MGLAGFVGVVVVLLAAAATAIPPLGTEYARAFEGAPSIDEVRAAAEAHADRFDPTLTPVVLVPGMLGSRLMATKDSSYSTPYFWCNWGGAETWEIWLQESSLLPMLVNCFFYDMQLTIQSNGSMGSRPGLSVYPAGAPGDVYQTMVMGPKNESDFGMLVMNLTAKGYQVGKNLFGSAYRWRYGPREWARPGGDWDQLVRVVEMASAANGGRPVSLVTISMGAPYLNVFLQRHVSQAWKDRYVRAAMLMSGVLGGSSSAVIEFTTGNNWGVSWIWNSQVRDLARTWPGVYFLTPSEPLWGDVPYVMTPDRNYSAAEFPELLQEMGATEVPLDYVAEMLGDTYVVDGPGVEVFCFYGYNVPTPYQLQYNVPASKISDTLPVHTTLSDGDGTVTRFGLTACERWENNANRTVTAKAFANVNHVQFLTDPALTEEVADLLASL